LEPWARLGIHLFLRLMLSQQIGDGGGGSRFRMTVTDAGPHQYGLTLWEGELISSRYERALAIDTNRGLAIYFAPYPGHYNDAMRRPDGESSGLWWPMCTAVKPPPMIYLKNLFSLSKKCLTTAGRAVEYHNERVAGRVSGSTAEQIRVALRQFKPENSNVRIYKREK